MNEKGYTALCITLLLALLLIRVLVVYGNPNYDAYCKISYGEDYNYGGNYPILKCVSIDGCNETKECYFHGNEYKEKCRHPRFWSLKEWRDVC